MSTGSEAEFGGKGPFMGFSRFIVANGMEEEVLKAFRTRPHLVDAAPGFLRMEVLQALDEHREFWLLTWWSDEASFQSWHRSHAHKASHAGMPKGLKLVPGSTQVRRLIKVAE